MSNIEHIAILKRGVKEWRSWRLSNRDIQPDLSGFYYANVDLNEVDFSGADLRGAILTRSNFSKANFIGAYLERVNLSGANLSGAYFYKANLSGADLSLANFCGADLSFAYLGGADLSGADLSETNLADTKLDKTKIDGANFSKSRLEKANFSNRDLRNIKFIEADLRMANLSGANLSGADLSGADLSRANLSRIDLGGAKCVKANLTNANLTESRLISANLDMAILSGAWLWETQRTGWSIKGVDCEFALWERQKDEKSYYKPGDFERLFADRVKIRLFYKNGIGPIEIATLPALIKHLESSHQRCELRLVSIKEAADGVVVELVIHDANEKSPEQLRRLKVALEAEARRKIEYQKQALSEREKRLRLEGALEQTNAIIDKLILRPAIHQGDVIMRDKYNVPGQAGAVGPNAHVHDMTFNHIVNRFEKSVDMSELAKQLAELREEMAKRHASSPQTAIALGKIAEAEVAAQEKNPSKVMEHLKAAGKWTLDFAKEVGKGLAEEAIKQSMGMK